MGEAFILEGAADAVAFELYIEQILAPSLYPGQIVIMDNLSIHQGAHVRQAIQAKGCQLLFLPAYSPDLSPIEEAFSDLKTYLRREGARTHEALFLRHRCRLCSLSLLPMHGLVYPLWLSDASFHRSHHPAQIWMSSSFNDSVHRSTVIYPDE